jgi:tRNA G18 (ribose-2'-O)-methylase SpoU
MADFNPFNVKDELKLNTVEEIRDWQKSVSIPYSIAMYNTVKDFNLASVIRNACAFGFEKIYIIGYRNWDRRGAVGAQNYVQIEHVDDFDHLVEEVGLNHIVALELPEHYPTVEERFYMLDTYPWSPGDCLLLGEEGCGIPVDHLEELNNMIYIRQPGCMRSLNAATASGIAMYHILEYAPMK